MEWLRKVTRAVMLTFAMEPTGEKERPLADMLTGCLLVVLALGGLAM